MDEIYSEALGWGLMRTMTLADGHEKCDFRFKRGGVRRVAIPQSLRRNEPWRCKAQSGTTEHVGGIYATQRLLESCRVAPGHVVLDIGCGTGYTASYLAQEYQARVVAIDISPRSVEEARKRGLQVTVLQADAHHLPFPADYF